MSASNENETIYTTDSSETVKKKINKYAFSGGQPDIEEHRKKGGNLFAIDFQKSFVSNEMRNLIKFEIERTEKYFHEGLKIFHHMKRKDQFPISLFLKGGNTIVKEIKRRNFDTLTNKIRISKISKSKILFTSLLDLYLGRDMRKL